MTLSRVSRIELPAQPRVLFGSGTWQETTEVVLGLAVKHLLFITTGDWKGSVIARLDQALRLVGIAVTHVSHGSSNTRDADIETAYQVFVEAGCDAVLSLGGGSAHDTGKALRTLAANTSSSIHDYTGRNPRRRPSPIPHIAINTTSGTGAEVSNSYVYTDTRSLLSPRKRFVIDRLAVPTVAIDDPSLMLSQPPWLVAFSGVDALTHAVEAYTAQPSHLIAQRYASHAVRLIYDNVESAVANPGDFEAMSGMCLGQCLAGKAFSHGGLGLVHSISHALSAHLDLHHGLANGVALPYVLQYNAPVALQKYAELAEILGLGNGGESVASRADSFMSAVRTLLERLYIPQSAVQALKSGHTYSALDKDRRVYEDLVLHILGDPCTETNAREVAQSRELLSIIRQIVR